MVHLQICIGLLSLRTLVSRPIKTIQAINIEPGQMTQLPKYSSRQSVVGWQCRRIPFQAAGSKTKSSGRAQEGVQDILDKIGANAMMRFCRYFDPNALVIPTFYSYDQALALAFTGLDMQKKRKSVLNLPEEVGNLR